MAKKIHIISDPSLPVQGGRTIPTPPKQPTQRAPTLPDTSKKEKEK